MTKELMEMLADARAKVAAGHEPKVAKASARAVEIKTVYDRKREYLQAEGWSEDQIEAHIGSRAAHDKGQDKLNRRMSELLNNSPAMILRPNSNLQA